MTSPRRIPRAVLIGTAITASLLVAVAVLLTLRRRAQPDRVTIEPDVGLPHREGGPRHQTGDAKAMHNREHELAG